MLFKLAIAPRQMLPVNQHGVPRIAPVKAGAIPGSLQGAAHGGMVTTGPTAAPVGSQPASADAHLFAGLGDAMAKGLAKPNTGRNVYAAYEAGRFAALSHFHAA